MIPETDAVSTIEPECCVRMTAPRPVIPLTAPMTLTWKARSQSSVVRLWMRPFGESTPALLIKRIERPNASVARATTASTWAMSLTSASTRLDRAAGLGQPADSLVERRFADVAQHHVGVGRAGEWAASAPPKAPAPVINDDRDGVM